MGNNKLTKVTKTSHEPENYNNLLTEIKSLIEKGLSSDSKARIEQHSHFWMAIK